MFDNLLRELRALERRSITVPIDGDEKGYIDKGARRPAASSSSRSGRRLEGHLPRRRRLVSDVRTRGASQSWFTKAQVRHAGQHAHGVIQSTIDGAMRADVGGLQRSAAKGTR